MYAAALVAVPSRVVRWPLSLSESIAFLIADRAIFSDFSSWRLLALQLKCGGPDARRMSSSNTRNSASLSVGARSARVSSAWFVASDNVYYVNLLAWAGILGSWPVPQRPPA